LVNLGVDASKILNHVAALTNVRQPQPSTLPAVAVPVAAELSPRQVEA